MKQIPDATAFPILIAVSAAVLSVASCSARPVVAPPPPPAASEARYDGRSLDEWMQALKSPDAKTRVGAAWAIGRIGPPAAAAVPALIEALSDPERLVRTQSIASLGKIGPAAAPAVPTLDHLAQDDDWATRQLASAALAAIQGSALPTNDAREKMPNSSSRGRRPSSM